MAARFPPMRYIDQSLAPGETVLQRGRWPVIFWVGAWAALILLGVALVGIFIFLAAATHMWTTDFAVTNKRVVVKRGWLNRRTAELAVESIEGVVLQQSLWARLCGYGRVIVTGTGDAAIAFPPMGHPIAFRRAIEQARGEASAVRVVHEDVANDREGAAVREANENADADEDDARPARRRRRRGFIGLR
jgi:uncharacterized membrane protein YdbT with pleckstrin-like domain